MILPMRSFINKTGVTYEATRLQTIFAEDMNLISDNITDLQDQIDDFDPIPVWGTITGTLSDQTDLQTALSGKEPSISSSTTAKYWRGDKSWQTLDSLAVTENTNLYFTTARARTSFSLTTTGSSGASTYDSSTGVFNIPNYASASTAWDKSGNSGTTAGTNFIGTTDAQDLVFKVNNVQAGRLGQVASQNTSFGVISLPSGATALGCAAFGYNALHSLTSGNSNAAFGSNAMQANTTGVANNAMGNGALFSNTTGSTNNAMGWGALYNNVSGNGNTAVGGNALNLCTSGQNTAIGYLAGAGITSGVYNLGIGINVMQATMTGDYNSAAGVNTLGSNTSGGQNSAFGLNSLYSNTTGSNNTALGRALQNSTTASNNIGVGWLAGVYNTTVGNQVFINSLDRTDYDGDQNKSPIYIQQHATLTSQVLAFNGHVRISTSGAGGGTPSVSSSALMQFDSTTEGIRFPRMTTTQRNAIASPVSGLLIYNTSTAKLNVYTTAWEEVTSA
jgi:hypothetical protein